MRKQIFVAYRNGVMRSVRAAISALGGDILVNIAASGVGRIAAIDVKDYQAVMDACVRAPVLSASTRLS